MQKKTDGNNSISKFLQKAITSAKENSEKKDYLFLKDYNASYFEKLEVLKNLQIELDELPYNTTLQEKQDLQRHIDNAALEVKEIQESYEQPKSKNKKLFWIGHNKEDNNLIYLDLSWVKSRFIAYNRDLLPLEKLVAQLDIKKDWNFFVLDDYTHKKGSLLSSIKAKEQIFKIHILKPSLSHPFNPLFGCSDIEIVELYKSISGSDLVAQRVSAIVKSLTYLQKVSYLGRESEKQEKLNQEKKLYKNVKSTQKPSSQSILDIPLVKLLTNVKSQEQADIRIFERDLISFKEICYFLQEEHLNDLNELLRGCPVITKDKEEIEELKSLYTSAINEMHDAIAYLNKLDITKYRIITELAYGAISIIFTSTRINPLNLQQNGKNRLIAYVELAPKKFKIINDAVAQIFLHISKLLSNSKKSNKSALIVNYADMQKDIRDKDIDISNRYKVNTDENERYIVFSDGNRCEVELAYDLLSANNMSNQESILDNEIILLSLENTSLNEDDKYKYR